MLRFLRRLYKIKAHNNSWTLKNKADACWDCEQRSSPTFKTSVMVCGFVSFLFAALIYSISFFLFSWCFMFESFCVQIVFSVFLSYQPFSICWYSHLLSMFIRSLSFNYSSQPTLTSTSCSFFSLSCYLFAFPMCSLLFVMFVFACCPVRRLFLLLKLLFVF